MARMETVQFVHDGGKFETNYKRRRYLKLAKVEFPQKPSHITEVATNMLRALVEGRTVEIDVVSRDRDGRSEVLVRVDGRLVNDVIRQTFKD